MKTTYINLTELSKLQKEVMNFVSYWVKTEKTPVPRKEIVKHMESKGTKWPSTVDALNALLKKGYIRRTYASYQNKTYYVQLRTI